MCDQGQCVDAVPTQRGDASGVVDSGQSIADAQLDTGPVSSRDVGPSDLGVVSNADTGQRLDTAPLTRDTGDWPVSGFGASCVVPDFTQGETDPCGVEDPNYFCIARLDGNGGYCTRACVIEAVNDGHHGGFDIGWHPHPHPCDEIGCCVPVEPGVDAGPFMPIDRFCRFGSDCN